MEVCAHNGRTALSLTLVFRRRQTPWKATREHTRIMFHRGVCTGVHLPKRTALKADVLNTFMGE